MKTGHLSIHAIADAIYTNNILGSIPESFTGIRTDISSMIPVGPQPLQCAVVGGNSLEEAFSGWDRADQSLAVNRITAEGVSDLSKEEWDCVVVEWSNATVDTLDFVEQCNADDTALPVVILVDNWSDERLAKTLSVANTTALPRTLAETDPMVLVERIVLTVQKEHARRSFQELYDNVSGPATLHDPDSGEMVHGNRALSELLGYDRSELLSMQIGDFTADVPGYGHERAMNVVRSATGRDDPIEVEWPLVTADERVRWVEAELRPVEIGGRKLVLSTSVDITGRRRQERKYQQVFDNVNDVITVHDPWDRDVVDVNETLCELTGYSREALLDMGVDGFSATEDGYTSERAYELQRTVAATGTVETTDWKFTTADGRKRFVEAVLSPAKIAGEDRVLVLARDVTERERREREYEQIFDMAGDGVVIHDPGSGEVVDVNQQVADLLGYDREAFINHPLSEFQASEEGVSGQQAREKIMESASDGTQEFEWPLETSDGETVWVRARHELGEIGGKQRVVAILHDITERKRREREYEQIFNGVQDGILLMDPDTLDILDANEAYLDLVGYEDVEAIQEQGVEGLSATAEGYTFDEGMEVHRRVAETGEPEIVEWRMETKLGHRRWLEIKVTPAVISGEVVNITVHRDITELKRREREYEQIFNSVHDAIVVHDPETADMVDVNESMCELLGYDRETILELGTGGISVTEEGYTVERAKEIIADVMAGEGPNLFEWKVETSDGEHRILEVRTTSAEIGGERRHVSINSDVTARRRREREFEQIFNGVNDAITIHDPETAELLEMNETFCNLLGYDRDEIVDMGIVGYSAEKRGFTEEQAREFVRDVVESGEPKQTEWAVETSDGETRWLEVKGTTVEIGGKLRFLAIDRDITEWRRTERRLSEILDRIDEAILMTQADTLTVDPRSAEYVSSGHEAIWGQSFEEIREKHDESILGTIHIDDVEEYQGHVEQIVTDISTDSAADSYSIEYRIERPDGQTRWVQSDYYPVDWERKQTRIVIVSRDVTDRKARERRIAAFDDATAELATADTPEEATRTAVDAATETLHLQTVGVFLYDNDSGVLRPEIVSGSLPETADTEPIEPGSNPLWEAFATGTTVASDGGRRGEEPAGEANDPAEIFGDLEGWRVLGLGNHGLLLVGSPTGTLDSETLQSAHVLAATLEAALNHLEGQQEIAAQEEQLQSQTQQIERLDRIARLTQQVEAAITDASTPGEIEQAICNRLANSGPYNLAWIGGLEVGSDQLTPHAVVGAPEQYVEQLQLKTTSETADPHPALAAWRSDELQVTDSIVGDGPADNWRREALAEGHQSLCAVPLTYDGITHGVLTVGTDSPGEFGDREREVLSQLGTAIGNAIAAIERRRALESDETIELEFRGSGDALPFAEVAEQIGCQVIHERTVSRQDSSLSVYYKIKGEFADDMLDSIQASFRGAVEMVTEASSPLIEVKTDNWFGSPLAEYGGVLRKARADPETTTLTVEVPRQADVRSFTERLQAEAPSLELVAKRQHRRQNQTLAELHDHIRKELTDRQFEVLRTAFSAGYFEWPRENDGSDIAESLDITQPTVNKHLRLAENQIFSLLIESAD
jgi:PAS domain S-box-containing protein